ncbi:MAG TPA: hypothetical protein VHF00_03375 [Acidimicrobiales bacterium]|nr:hypothetical protein [Acidimicrobiales bacterium]
MDLLHADRAGVADLTPTHPWWRRAWRLPLAVHVAALAVALVALVPFVGPGVSFSADEGAAIVQARHLARGDGWIVDHPVPEADPDGGNYPLELSARGPDGRTAPFAKHPLYAVLLGAASRLGGVTAMVLLSVAGTVAAAALAAALAGRMGRGVARPALWAVGVGSPLLFDGYLVIAHTLGAALAAGAVLCAVRAFDDRRRWLSSAAGVLACAAVAVLLRTEATLFALALAATVAVAAVVRRQLQALAVAAAALIATAGASLVEDRWVRHIMGGPSTTTGSFNAIATGLAARLKGFRLTWLMPSYTGSRAHDLALLAMIGLLAAAAIIARRRPDDGPRITLLAGTAAAASIAALVTGPDTLVPGLVLTLPLAAGVLLVRRHQLGSPATLITAGTFALFALGVLATQYPQGGSGEWGGRYFALGLPLLVPLALAALASHRRQVDGATARTAAAALVVCTAAVSVMAVASLRSSHRFTSELMARIERGGEQVGERPVLVTTAPAVPRLAWQTFDRQRWLLADEDDEDDLVDLVGRLRRAGVGRFGLVTNQLPRDQALVEQTGARIVGRDGRPDGGDWQVLVVDAG